MEIQNTQIYEIDFDKIQTVEDLKRLLKGLKIRFGTGVAGFDEFKDLLKEVK